MPKFVVTCDYSSERAGPWKKGDVVSLDNQELLDWLERDAPGLLEVEKARQVEKPPQDRMVKGTRKRTVKKDED